MLPLVYYIFCIVKQKWLHANTEVLKDDNYDVGQIQEKYS